MICVPRPPDRERLEDVQSRQASRCAREWITHRNWRWFAPGPGAQIAAGYLKPVLGRLRRNRRRAFAAAVTRYLKPVYAAEPVGIEDFARRQTLGTWPRKVTRELSEGWLVPTLPPPGTCGCNHRAPGRQRQADPARRAARSPSTGSGAAAEPFQHPETATRSNEARVGTRGPQLARDAPAATCLRLKKRPPTRHYLRTSSDNRRSVRVRAGVRSRRWPPRSGRYAALRAVAIAGHRCGAGDRVAVVVRAGSALITS